MNKMAENNIPDNISDISDDEGPQHDSWDASDWTWDTADWTVDPCSHANIRYTMDSVQEPESGDVVMITERPMIKREHEVTEDYNHNIDHEGYIIDYKYIEREEIEFDEWSYDSHHRYAKYDTIIYNDRVNMFTGEIWHEGTECPWPRVKLCDIPKILRTREISSRRMPDIFRLSKKM